jgi:hypothetical protein
VLLVPEHLQPQVGNDRITGLDGPRMGCALGSKGGFRRYLLVLEAFLRAGMAE